MKNEECCASLSKREYASSLLSLLLHPFFICYCFLLFLLMKPAKLSIRYNRLPCFQKLDLIDGQHHVINSANSLSRLLPWEQYEVLKWSLKDFVRILTHVRLQRWRYPNVTLACKWPEASSHFQWNVRTSSWFLRQMHSSWRVGQIRLAYSLLSWR